ncbi:MAG: AraC family transcriptional regulator [Ruminococcaceae bacterium]|nr:AraC family transcriptional regulator [Oscillospiraceae bacterium]
MALGITLGYFGVQDRYYHLRRIGSSQVKEEHYHDYFQICYVLRGEMEHYHADKMVSLGQGDAFIIPPGLTHRLVFVSTETEIYSLSFDEHVFSPGFPQSGAYKFLSMLQEKSVATREQPVKRRVILDSDQRKNVQALLECLMREQETAYPREMSSAPSLISAILYTLSQSYYQQPQNAEEFNEATAYANTLTRCTEYIDQHYMEHITLDILVKQFALSRSTFCTLFPQFTGLSLKQYISRKRILEAEALIRSHPELPLQEVASMVGYEEISTFYRNFVRIAGVSPSKYKEICSGKEDT